MSQSKKRKFKKSVKQQRRPLRKKAKTKRAVAKSKKNVVAATPATTPPARRAAPSPTLTDDELNALKNATDAADYTRIAREIKGRRDPSGANNPMNGFYPPDWFPKVIAPGGVLEQLRTRWAQPDFGTVKVQEPVIVTSTAPHAGDQPPPAPAPAIDAPPPGEVQTAIAPLEPPAPGPNPLPGDTPVNEY